MLKIADVELLFTREPPLNVRDYPEMVKVGFEDHFVQVIYLCSTSEKENKSIWNVQTLTNAALYAAQAAHFKCIFETKIVFSAGVGWWLLPGASWWINSNLHLMVKSCDPQSLGVLFYLKFNSFKMKWRRWYIFKRFGKLETNLLYSSFKNFFGVSWLVLTSSMIYNSQKSKVYFLLSTQ